MLSRCQRVPVSAGLSAGVGVPVSVSWPRVTVGVSDVRLKIDAWVRVCMALFVCVHMCSNGNLSKYVCGSLCECVVYK